MKTSKTNSTSCKPFVLVAALASLLLCSCASNALVQKQARLQDRLAFATHALDHEGDSGYYDDADARHLEYKINRTQGELAGTQQQIAQQRAENLGMLVDVLGAALPLMQRSSGRSGTGAFVQATSACAR